MNGNLTLRPAFTLIEVIVSTMIIGFVVIAVLELSTKTADSALYLAHRNKAAFQDSLFLDPSIVKYHKETKNAEEILHPQIKALDDETKTVFKALQRDVFVPDEPLIIPFFENMGATSAFDRIVLKEKYSATYYHFTFSMSGDPQAMLNEFNQTLMQGTGNTR